MLAGDGTAGLVIFYESNWPGSHLLYRLYHKENTKILDVKMKTNRLAG